MDQAEWLEERERDLDELRSRLEEARGRYIFGQKRLLAAFPRMRSPGPQEGPGASAPLAGEAVNMLGRGIENHICIFYHPVVA